MTRRHLIIGLAVLVALVGSVSVISAGKKVAYWLPALGDGSPNSTGAVARRSENVSSALADFFAAHTGLFAGGLGGLLALGVALFLQRSFAHRQPTQIEGNQA